MKKSSKELKRLAREQLNGRYSIPMGAFVIASLIPSIIEIPFSFTTGTLENPIQTVIFFLAEYLITLISAVLQIGVIHIHLNLTRGIPFQVSSVFDPFRRGADRFFGAAFLTSLLTVAASLPMVAAGAYLYVSGMTVATVLLCVAAGLISLVLSICVTLYFNFASYLLLDYPQMKVTAAFRECRRLMLGNKGRFLYLILSFIGWECLVACSMGIASLWVNPYISQTYVTFYLDATGELDRIPPRVYPDMTMNYSNPMY